MTANKFDSGSTCTSILATPSHFFFANVGDSRSILVSRSVVRFETKDHKPCDPLERQRINRHGGYIQMNRVNGNLALSRAFGDFFLKRNSSGMVFQRNYNQLQQPVIAMPTVTIVERDHKHDQFLMLACDGVTDVFQTRQLIDYTISRFKVISNARDVVNDIIDATFARGNQ